MVVARYFADAKVTWDTLSGADTISWIYIAYFWFWRTAVNWN